MTRTDVSDETGRQGGGMRVAVLFVACVLFVASVVLMVAAIASVLWPAKAAAIAAGSAAARDLLGIDR